MNVHRILYLTKARHIDLANTCTVTAVRGVIKENSRNSSAGKLGTRLLVLEQDFARGANDSKVLVLSRMPSKCLIRNLKPSRNLPGEAVEQVAGTISDHVWPQVSWDMHIIHEHNFQLFYG
jgi:hypothetical protein